MAAASSRGQARRHHGQPGLAHRPVSVRRDGNPDADRAARHQEGATASASSGARANNLKNVTPTSPLGTFTAVTGVSGGGKSTFPDRDALQGRLGAPHHGFRGNIRPNTTAIEGLEFPRQGVIRTSTSRRSAAHPALQPRHLYRRLHGRSATGFQGLPESKAREESYNSPAASPFNVQGGRGGAPPAALGEARAQQGRWRTSRIEMHSLEPDVYVTATSAN